MLGLIFRKLNFDIGIKSEFGQLIFSKSHKLKRFFDIILILLAFCFSKKKNNFAAYGRQFEKNIFSYYLKVDLYGFLSRQGTDEKKT